MIYRPVRWSLAKASPAAEPVILLDGKEHARITGDDEDWQFEKYIAAATRKLEGYLNRALIDQTWTFKISEFPSRTTDLLELPGGTLQSVSSITYVDTDGATQTWASSNYIVDTARAPGRVGLAYDKDWPDTREWDLPITITYVVGFGAAGTAVPDDITHAIKFIAAWMYDNRGSEGVDVPRTVMRSLAGRYRIQPALLGAD